MTVVWKYFEILRKPNKAFFFSKDCSLQKIEALEKIAKYGTPSHISNIIFVLDNENEEVRKAACNAIISLFQKITNKKEYYNTLKYCEISKTDIDQYKSRFAVQQLVYLLIIGSLNHDGFVREKAVMELGKVQHDKAIQFIMYRLADWVSAVRLTAERALEQYLAKEYLDALIENLPTIDWLKEVERTNLEIFHKTIVDYVFASNRAYIIEKFYKYSDKLRFIIAKHISASLQDKNELRFLLDDKHFLIRSLVLAHLDLLNEDDINLLINDKSGKVRLNTLYALRNRVDFEELIKDFIADESSSIRHLARFTLNNQGIDFAEYYRSELFQNQNIIGSLFGLADVRAHQYSSIVEPYLLSPHITVKKAAMIALSKLDEDATARFAFENIDTEFIGLRHIIVDFLSIHYDENVLHKASMCFKKGDESLKIAMLNLFSRIAGWDALATLIEGTIDANENIRHIAIQHIYKWKSQAVTLYATPSAANLDKIRTIYAIANKMYESKQFSHQNPLEELEFYFR